MSSNLHATGLARCEQGDPTGWMRTNRGPFSAALPPGWRYESQEGVDSFVGQFVGQFVGDGITLDFDYGNFWLNAPPDTSGHEVTRTHVDFRAADIYVPPPVSGRWALGTRASAAGRRD
ncbi:MAG: hypothetical protein ABI780_05030, partial [Ardenticatenales bacterium]